MTKEKKPEKRASGDRKKKKKSTSKEKPDDHAVPLQDAEDGAKSHTSPRKSKGAIDHDETTERAMTKEEKPEKGASGDRKKKKKSTSMEKPDDRAVPLQDAEDGAKSHTSPRKAKGTIAPGETTERKSRSPKSKKQKSTMNKGEVSSLSSPSKKKRDHHHHHHHHNNNNESPKEKKSKKKKSKKKTVTHSLNETPNTEPENSLEEKSADGVSEIPKSAFVLESEKALMASRPMKSRKIPLFSPTNGESVGNAKFSSSLSSGFHSGFRAGLPAGI
jgi:hypothetical protein